ncbi:chalcone isomerase family protein [Ferrimonas balearica]|uniref:chalcone isomerase family protein n=1 Tax=Ferrimonas balearica TaxID=44012 RepID=UPI001C9A1C53|nr:chalcone isomerase family protein [Ferrimonas balearica]MBY5992919.1 chalcone isomerase family protein [Ferrimonas balearica]
MKHFTALLALALSVLIPAQARTVADVTLQESITVQGDTLSLYGAGIRTKYFMKLYVGSLYGAETGLDAKGVLASEQTTAVRLNIISGMITSDRMIDTIEEGFDTATGGNVAPLRERLDNFLAVFDEAVEVGDQFTMVSIPGSGLEAYKNGELLTLVEGDDFRQALFAIWLGEKPADKKLKRAMLGQ